MTDFADLFSIQRPFNRQADNRQADGNRQGDRADTFRLRQCGITRLEDALESDRGRIINSAAVRRLQQKTQVFPLERNAAVRSRLTHSLEVQQTGRFIVRTVFRLLGKNRLEQLGLGGLDRACETLVEMACLMHDIGNPPFGHFGEAALSKWFADHLRELAPFREVTAASWDTAGADEKALTAQLARELQSFEGNAQAIRLIAHLQKLNLTYLQAAAAFKYTRPATEPRPPADHPLSYLQKKPGYYFSETGFVAAMQQALGMAPGHRHPLAYIMEAADDISYCLADLEDGVDKGLMSYTQLAERLVATFDELRPDQARTAHFGSESFASLVDYALKRAGAEDINREHEFFVWLRVKVIHPLVQHAARAFIDNLAAIREGSLNRALLEDDSACHTVIGTFKRVAVKHVFSVPEVETLELQGYRIITGLLDHFKPLLLLSRADFARLLAGQQKGLLVESRLYKRLPNKHVKAYLAAVAEDRGVAPEVWERYCRCRLLQDMVSGMTDQFALDEFHTLSVTRAI
ncbi:MAG: dGTPase [Marinobacter sp.]|uniref:dGTPase n=1 Tax=Marinobacter sp. TaxID=50741 RepID=UPI00299D364A|nr:dGTPase [Marinobacter sp.]MDX1634239.1 dGTPase [Marinobacter sp.]